MDWTNKPLIVGFDKKGMGNLPIGQSSTPLDHMNTFLIWEAMRDLTIKSEQLAFEIQTAPPDQFSYANISTYDLVIKYEHLLPQIRNLILRIHIDHKKLLHPFLMRMILDDSENWIQESSMLVKVMRTRAKWVSNTLDRWSWWKYSISTETWNKPEHFERYNLMKILRTYQVSLTHSLIQETWEQEPFESQNIILVIIAQTLKKEDEDFLTWLKDNTGGHAKTKVNELCIFFPNRMQQEPKFKGSKGDIIPLLSKDSKATTVVLLKIKNQNELRNQWNIALKYSLIHGEIELFLYLFNTIKKQSPKIRWKDDLIKYLENSGQNELLDILKLQFSVNQLSAHQWLFIEVFSQMNLTLDRKTSEMAFHIFKEIKSELLLEEREYYNICLNLVLSIDNAFISPLVDVIFLGKRLTEQVFRNSKNLSGDVFLKEIGLFKQALYGAMKI